MRKLFFFIPFLCCTFLFLTSYRECFAQQVQNTPVKQEFSTGNVEKILQEGQKQIDGTILPFQKLQIHILDGSDKGKTIITTYGEDTSITLSQEVAVGDTLILEKSPNAPNGKTGYVVYDKDRLTSIFLAIFVFFALACLIAGWKGLGSILGLIISLSIILFYMVPQILAGTNPLGVSIIASLAILLLTTYLAHGVSKQTTVALFSTFISLMLTVWLSSFFVHSSHLTGLNDETATLLFGPTSRINMQGLLLAGIIIGTLGALNDITTTQAATIFSLAKQDTTVRFKKLFLTGFAIGREHIVSMINTLVLAYTGAALALFLFLVLNPQKIPYWVIINNEDLSDEIIRTIAGSIGLILVVPIVTLLAAALCDKRVQEFFDDIVASFVS